MSNNKLYLHNIDLNKNQIVNPVLHNATTAPLNPADGQLYYNTTTKKVYYYNSTTATWTEVGAVYNIYNLDGTITSNRTVTLNGNTITFVGNTASLGVEFQSRVNVKGALTVSDFLTFNGSTSANKTIYANSLTFTTNNTLGYGSDQSIFTFSTAVPNINSGNYTTTLVNLLMPVNTGTQAGNSRALLIDFSITTNAGSLTAIQTVRGDNFFNSTDGNTYIGHSSVPSTTAKLSVNGTIQYTGNLISSGSGGNYTLSLRSGATANDFGRITAYTNGSSLTEMQSLEFGYYKTNLNSNYEFSNTNYNEWGFRVYGTITGTATGGGVYSSLLINPTLNITGNTNTSTYYGIRIAATETSTTNTTVIPFSYTHIGGTFTASNVIVNNSKIVKFTNSGASGNWGGGFGFYGGVNGNNGVLALRVYSSGTADSNNAVMIGDVVESGVQSSSIRFVVKSRVASGSESSYDDVQVIYTDSNAYAITGSKILNGLVFGVGNGSSLPSSSNTSTYAVAIGFQIDPLTNGWGTSLIISGKNDTGVMAEIARFTGKNKNLLVGTTTDSGSYKIEAAGLIRGTGLHSTTGNLVIGTELNYSSFQGVGNEGAVQVTGTTSGYSTKMIFRPYGNASGYTSNYWGMIEQNGFGFGISSGNYHNFYLYNGGSLRMTLLSADGTYSPYTNKVSITNNTGLGVLSITGSVGYSTITTSVDAVSGTLVPGTYYYRIVAFDESKHLSITSAQLSIVVPAGSSTNKVTITGITLPLGCRFYKVYRGTAVNNTYSYVSPTFDGASTFTDLGFVTNPGTYAPQNIPNTGTYAGFSSLGILYAKNFSGRQIVLNKELVTSDGLYVVSLPNADSISEANMGSGTNYVFGNLQYNNTSTWTGVNIAIGGITGALGYTTMSSSITIGSNFAYGGGLMTYTDSSVFGFSIGYAIAGGATITRSTIIQNGTSQLWSSTANTSGTAKSVTSSFIWRSPWTGTGDYRLDSFPDTLSNVAIFGSYNSMINDVWFGNGGTGLANIVNYTIHGSEIAYDPSAATIAAGGTTMTYFTNSVGGSIVLAGGRGRGTGTPGKFIVQTSTATTTGTTLQTLSNRLEINGTGQLKLNGYTSTSVFTGTVAGLLGFDSSGNVITSVVGVTGSGTAGQITYWSGTSAVTGSSNLVWDNATGRLGIGTSSPSATLNIVGAGNTSATTALTVQNSDATGILRVRNDNKVLLNQLGFGNDFPEIFSTVSGAYDVNGGSLSFNSSQTNYGVASYNFYFRHVYSGKVFTSGTGGGILQNLGFSPTSGTGIFNQVALTGNINQTGGANGITRGLYINPTLTAAADFRAIETTAGNVLFGSNFFWDNTNNRLGIGVTSPTSTLHIQGAGNTSATNALLVQNSDGTSILKIGNDRTVTIGIAGGAMVVNTNSTTVDRMTFQVVRDGVNPNFFVSSVYGQNASGTYNIVSTPAHFQPTSGTAVYNTLVVNPTVNQTGGANGITRGLYVAPTLTAAADWRSIEWANNSGYGIYGAGTANNYIGGSLGIGTTSLTGFSLCVSKNITGSVFGTGIAQNGIVQSDVTSTAFGIINTANSVNSAFSFAYSHFAAAQGTIGASSTLSTQTGFLAASSMNIGSSIYGFRGQIVSGSGRFNLYMDGTANNYVAGNFGFQQTSPTAIADFGASTTTNASLRIRSGTAPTSPNDGDIWFTGTDLKIQIGGSTKTFTVI